MACHRAQVQADVYEKIDKELLGFVEDVLLNRRDDATERMLEYAGTLHPKSKPTAVKKLAALQEPTFSPKVGAKIGGARLRNDMCLFSLGQPNCRGL